MHDFYCYWRIQESVNGVGAPIVYKICSASGKKLAINKLTGERPPPSRSAYDCSVSGWAKELVMLKHHQLGFGCLPTDYKVNSWDIGFPIRLCETHEPLPHIYTNFISPISRIAQCATGSNFPRVHTLLILTKELKNICTNGRTNYYTLLGNKDK